LGCFRIALRAKLLASVKRQNDRVVSGKERTREAVKLWMSEWNADSWSDVQR
jgi:hypothetical protein